MSHVLAVAPVLPEHVYDQEEITAVIGPLLTRDPGRLALLRRVHRNAGVEQRHLALPLTRYAGIRSFGVANAVFVQEGTRLAVEACRTALDAAGLRASDVDLVFFTSVTGVSAPSLDVLVAQELGLRPQVRRVPSFGMGCAGGAGGLARVHDLLAGRPRDAALLVSVELCSLTVQHGDDSTANLVSSGLFGDAASAVVVVGDEHPAAPGAAGTGGAHPVGSRTARVVDSRSRLFESTTADLGWQVRDSGFGIVLSAGLPDLIGSHLAGEVKALLVEHGLAVEQVPVWVVHAGGPRVIGAVQEALGLADEAVRESWVSLARVGNVSSSSVLHVLAATLERSAAPPGSPAVLMAFGPGVSAELVLLRLGGVAS